MPFCTTLFTLTPFSPSTFATSREHPGRVLDLEVEVERRLDLLARHEAQCSTGSSSMPGELITDTTSPRTADAVCGPPAPGPDSVTSVIASDSSVTALNGPAHRGQRMASVQEAREHAHAGAAVEPLRDAEQLQHQAELLRVVEVVGRDLLDALERDLVEAHGCVEREPREDRHLGRGVLAVHVLGRVGLRVAELLRPARARGVARPCGPSR